MKSYRFAITIIVLIYVASFTVINRHAVKRFIANRGGRTFARYLLAGHVDAGVAPTLSAPEAISTQEKSTSVSEIDPATILPRKTAKTVESKTFFVASNHTPEPPASISYASNGSGIGPENQVAVGFDAGFNYLIPVLSYQKALSTTFAFGMAASYMENLTGPRVSVVGGKITGTYFLDKTPFRGYFAQTEVGMYDFKAENFFRSSQATPVIFAFVGGWEGTVAEKLNLALSAGAQYAYNGTRDIGDIYFNKLLPLLKLSIGFDF